MKKILFIFIPLLSVVMLVSLTLFSQEKDKSEKAPDMVVYVGLEAEEGEFFASSFRKHIGENVTIKIVKIRTGQLVETLEKAGEKCEASIVFGGSLPAYQVAADKGLFMEFTPPSAAKYDKKFIDKKGRWVGIYVGVIGFGVNGKMGLSVPESWEDLLKPEFKGKVAIADPNYSGTSYITLSTLVQLMGEKEAFEYMKKLDGQIADYPRSGSEPAKMAARGDVAVGISFAHDILRVAKNNPHLKLSFPREGTGLEIGGAAIPLHAPNPELAKKFLDFLASPAAQNFYGTHGIPPRFPTHPKAKRPDATLSRGKTLKLIDFDFTQSAKDEQRLKKLWTKEIIEPRKGAE